MESNKKFVDLLRKAISVTRGRISEREVFRDFIAFCALQLSVLTDPVHPERAEQLQKIKENYETEELTAFSQTFLELAQTIERNIDQGVYEDLLGMAYNECGATNRALEQVFTPPDVARLMAQFVFGQLKELPSEGHFTVVFKEAGFTEVERNPNDVALSIELSYYNNYYEDMILELLNTLVPFTAEGFISYRGEKGDLWCHVFAGGEWTERSGRICYDEPRPQFEESKQNLARLIEEIRRQVIYDDRPYEDRARDLLKAFEAHDPDGVLLALSGRRLREHGVAAAIWQDGGESAHPDEGE